MQSTDTIIALASGSTPAGVAVVRLSGDQAFAVLQALTGQALTGQSLPEPRRMVLRNVQDPRTGEVLDRALVVRFASPNSFTGEDVVELHLHGGPAIVAGVIAAILDQPGCRQAVEGEFTRRAFDHGRLDLTAVEGLSDLVRARTAAQRRQALSAAGGAAHRVIEAWKDQLLRARALVETMIDFVDEDIPDDLLAGARNQVQGVRQAMATELGKAQAGLAVREGLYVAIVGAPNVGKSTLLNALAGREAAIVSSIAGTTRDVVQVTFDLGGHLVVVSDTAGIRETMDEIEAEGVLRARRAMAEADFCIEVRDLSEPVGAGTAIVSPPIVSAEAAGVLFWNKADQHNGAPPSDGISGSAKSGVGVDTLRDLIAEQARRLAADGETAVIQRSRHQTAIAEAAAALALWDDPALSEEILASALERAIASLGQVVGAVHVEHMLDIIFREFCIGK
jgi:tRNA modification GTPase